MSLFNTIAAVFAFFMFTAEAQAQNTIMKTTLFCAEKDVLVDILEAPRKYETSKVMEILTNYVLQGDCALTHPSQPYFVEPINYYEHINTGFSDTFIWDAWLYVKHEKTGQFVILKGSPVYIVMVDPFHSALLAEKNGDAL